MEQNSLLGTMPIAGALTASPYGPEGFVRIEGETRLDRRLRESRDRSDEFTWDNAYVLVSLDNSNFYAKLSADYPSGTSKKLFWLVQDSIRKEHLQLNWGRVHEDEKKDYVRIFKKAFASSIFTTTSHVAEFLATASPPAMEKLISNLVHRDLDSTHRESIWKLANAVAGPKEEVLESFDGFLESIDGDIAFVSLQNETGEVLEGEYDAHKLEELGILEGRRFKCWTVSVGGRVEVKFEAVKDNILTEEQLKQIREEVNESLGTDLGDDDF